LVRQQGDETYYEVEYLDDVFPEQPPATPSLEGLVDVLRRTFGDRALAELLDRVQSVETLMESDAALATGAARHVDRGLEYDLDDILVDDE
jgi:hypothetical protein